MKLEFGGGETPKRPDFTQVDVRKITEDTLVCNAWDIDKHVKPNTVTEIYSRHFFEHLTFAQGEKVLDVWKTILVPGGKCEMLLPNLTFHIHQWVHLREDPKSEEWAKAGFWGWQRGELEDTWDVHKSGYDSTSLIQLLISKDYKDIESLKSDKSKNIHVRFFKEKG